MRYAQRQFRPATRRPAGRRRTPVWSSIKAIAFIAAIGCAGWLLFQRFVHDQIGPKVQTVVDSFLADSGLSAHIHQANFIENKGLQVRHVSLTENDVAGHNSLQHSLPIMEIYEAFVQAPVSLPELVAGNLNVKSVEVRRARLNLTKDAFGKWNFESALAAISNLQPQGDARIPVIFRDCQIEVLDQTVIPPRQLRISNLTLSVIPVEHEGRVLTQINGHFAARSISDFKFTAWIDAASQTWTANLDASDLRLSRDSLFVLPPAIATKLHQLTRLEGHLSARGTVSGDLAMREAPVFDFQGRCSSIAIGDQRLSLPIENTSFDFAVSTEGFAIQAAKGDLGEGKFELDHYSQSGWLFRRRWSAKGRVNDFHYKPDHRIDSLLPAHCQKFCREFKPHGTSNIAFQLDHDGQHLTRTIRSELTDMSFTFVGMPYQIDHCVGFANIVDGDCRFQVQAMEGEQPIELRGIVRNLGHNGTFECNIRVPGGLPVNDKMLTATDAQPKLSRVVRAFNAQGFVGGVGLIERRVPRGPVHKTLDVHLHDIAIRHDAFEYPIRNISGLVQTRDDQYTFSQLVGSNGNGKVSCNGTWNPRAGLKTQMICETIPLDDQLRVALKPSLREIWHGFRPRGTVDFMQVDMTLPIGQAECNVTVEARMNKGSEDALAGGTSIRPTWFPYEIRNLSGVVKIGDGKVQLTEIAGRHNRTWVVGNGDGEYSDESWSIRLKDLLVGSLEVDDDLLAAVPATLAPQVRNLNYAGKVNVQGEVTLAGRYLETASEVIDQLSESPSESSGDIFRLSTGSARSLNDSTFSLAWNVRLDMDRAQMMVGVPVENVFGTVKLVGQYDGQLAECEGELDIDSLTIYDNQITNVRGPIWLDNERAAAGLFAKPNVDPQKIANTSPTQTANKTDESVTGELHGGVVKFDAQINSGPTGEFYTQTTLADGALETTCRELCPSIKDVTGRTFAAMRLSGNCTGTHTYRGDGTIQLRDAKIYELPPVLSLLKLLKIGKSNRTAFDASNVNFTIAGETIDLNRIEMLGDAISLIGNGRVNLDRKLDLNFYSIVGRNRLNIPLISDMYHASSQQALWIQVTGSIDNPITNRTVLPQLNDSLKQLFQGPAPGSQPRYATTNALAPSRSNGSTSRAATRPIGASFFR